LPSPHQLAIILHFREDKADEFERLFEHEVLPMLREFKADRKFASVVLSRIVDEHVPKGIRAYLLELEVLKAEAHDEFDSSKRFLAFLGKAKEWQPIDPDVWIGEPLFRI
jgi:hypothetical protein